MDVRRFNQRRFNQEQSNQQRSDWFQQLAIELIAIVLASVVCGWSNGAAAAGLEMTVYRDPACGCCKGWIAHLHAQGFQITDIETSQMDAVKQQHGISEALASCHTGLIDGYAIEGHVPVEDIDRLISEHPNVNGITVPGMPVGTPGMEDGDRHDSFTVYSFKGEEVQRWSHYDF